MKQFTIFLCLLLCITGCISNSDDGDPASWTKDQLDTWFDDKAWLGSAALIPDSSIDKKQFAVRYHQQKERWDKAFAFLRRDDLSAIEPGNHEIDGKDVYAIVSQYNSKNPEDVRFEAHKKYTDLQYVISGNEYIGLSGLSRTVAVTPYDEERDIAFYQAEDGVFLAARPGRFFIFFPDNVHRPGLKIQESVPVKKLVIKVKN